MTRTLTTSCSQGQHQSSLSSRTVGEYPIRTKIISHGSTESIKALTKIVRWREREEVVYHDPRHVDCLAEKFGLGNANTVQAPAADVTSCENSEPLDQEQFSECRSHVARCFFLTHDRADITFTVNSVNGQSPHSRDRLG